jgi:hypothetical protein
MEKGCESIGIVAIPFSDTSLLKIQRATDHEALFLSCQLDKMTPMVTQKIILY